MQAPPRVSTAQPADRPHPRLAWPSPRPAAYAPPPPYWQGTLLPASDADIWLSTGFARLERMLAELNAPAAPGATPTDPDDDLGVELGYHRSLFGRAARAGLDKPLAETRPDMGDVLGYQLVAGKGVLFLHTLRDIVGHDTFDAAMRRLGRERNGQRVGTHDFQTFLQRHTQRPLGPLFDWWTRQPGLPLLGVAGAESRPVGKGWEAVVTLDVSRIGPALAVPVTVETAEGDVTQAQVFDAEHAQIRISTRAKPLRVVVDKHGTTARGNGSPFTILTMDDELEHALIVYGTQDEAVGNHEAAKLLQTALRRREHNVQPPIRADREVTEDELRGHHLLLVGRPTTNAVRQRLAAQWPVDFGPRSFTVRGQTYTHPESAVLAAGDNPLNPRYSAVLVAGLGSLGTYQTVGKLSDDVLGYAPIVIAPFGRDPRELVPPLPGLTVVPNFP